MSVGFGAPERGEQGHVANFCVIRPTYYELVGDVIDYDMGKKVADLMPNLGTFCVSLMGVTSNDVLLVCGKLFQASYM